MARPSAGEARLTESVAPARPGSGGLDPLESAVFLASRFGNPSGFDYNPASASRPDDREAMPSGDGFEESPSSSAQGSG
jgi:hypothetical protein